MSIFLKKPKILRDVRPRGADSVFRKIKNVSEDGRFLFRPVPRLIKNTGIVLAVVFLSIFLSDPNFSILAPTALSQVGAAEQKALEEELGKIEREIDQYEKNISDLQNEQKTLGQGIKLLDAQINKLALQIKATDVQLRKLDSGIGVLQKDITATQGDIGRLRVFLAGSLRQIYNDGDQGLLEMVLNNEKVSDLFDNINGLALVQEEVRDNLSELVELKTNLVEKKDTLSTERVDVLNLKSIKEQQKIQLDAKKREKNYLVKVTKGQESAYQELLKKSKQTAAQIRSRIFEFLGGGALSFGEAYKLAKFASEQTGVRAALILAILDKESGIGRNVGKCNWKEAMHPRRDQPIFIELMEELGINPDSVAVSCAISSDGAYGGAMGPSQFIPSTWVAYKDRIGAITGNRPPSPWKNIDAIMATALYMKDLGAGAKTFQAERAAAAKYYAGSRWQTYLRSYGQWVVSKADKFQEDINSIEGS